MSFSRVARGRSGFVLMLLVAACGAPPPGPATPPPPAPALEPKTAKEPPVDVSPLPEPNNLVVLARVNKPDAIVKTVANWTHLPLPGGRELIRQVNETLSDVVDLSQPIDAAVAVTLSRHGVDPLPAVSVGVRSFDEARSRIAARYKTNPVTNGGLKIHGLLEKGGRAEMEDEDDDEREVCVLAHAASGAKLVCGPGGAVDALTPYMTRTMPRESWKADLHVEVRPEPVRAPLAELRGALPMLARSLTGSSSPAVRELIDASVGEAVDLVDDSQKLLIDATIDDAGIKATSRFEFQGTKSVFARSLTDASRAEPAPAAFWHLPGDTDTALFMRGSDPKLYDHPRAILANLLTEGLDAAQLPPAEKKAVNDLIADKMLRLFTNGGVGIYAKGFDASALDKALKARGAVKDGDWAADLPAKRAIAEQAIGWHLYQVSDPIAKVGPILKDWSLLWNRPSFAKWMESKTGSKAKDLPKMKVSPVPAGITLPKDTVHLELSVALDDIQPAPLVPPPPPAGPRGSSAAPPAAKMPKPIPQKPIVVHVFAVPDGSSTWLALSLDAKLVGTKIGQALSTAPDANTLGKTAQGIELLKEPKINGGGLVTMRGFLVATALEGGQAGERPSAYEVLTGLPNKGATPIVFTGRAEGPSGAARAGASMGQVLVTRQAIEDVVKLMFSRH